MKLVLCATAVNLSTIKGRPVTGPMIVPLIQYRNLYQTLRVHTCHLRKSMYSRSKEYSSSLAEASSYSLTYVRTYIKRLLGSKSLEIYQQFCCPETIGYVYEVPSGLAGSEYVRVGVGSGYIYKCTCFQLACQTKFSKDLGSHLTL